jgi:hypothetical protein
LDRTTYRSIPNSNLLIPTGSDHPASILIDQNISHKIRVLQGEISLPPISSDKTFSCLVSGRRPQITICVKEELVHASFMWKKGFGLVTSTNELELADLSITSAAEHGYLAFFRLGVNGKIQDTTKVTLKCLGPLAAGNVEDEHFGIGASGDQYILILKFRTDHRFDKVTVSFVPLARLSRGHVPAPDGLVPTAGEQQFPVRAET